MKTTRHDSFAAYVLPSVLAFALSGLYTIVDGFFIGQSLGDLGLAAITLAYPAAALLQAVGTGIGLAGAIRCTILQARGEEQTPRTCFSGTVLLLLATSAAFAAVLLGLLGPVLTVLSAQDEARPLAAEYIRVIACGTAFQILATGLVPFIRNLGGHVGIVEDQRLYKIDFPAGNFQLAEVYQCLHIAQMRHGNHAYFSFHIIHNIHPR